MGHTTQPPCSGGRLADDNGDQGASGSLGRAVRTSFVRAAVFKLPETDLRRDRRRPRRSRAIRRVGTRLIVQSADCLGNAARAGAGPFRGLVLRQLREAMRYILTNSGLAPGGLARRWFLGPRVGSGLDVILGPCRLPAAIATPSFPLPLAVEHRWRPLSTIVRPVFQGLATGPLGSPALAPATSRRFRKREARADVEVLCGADLPRESLS